MRIVHVVPTLCNGGTERFLINLLANTSADFENWVIAYNEKNYWKQELDRLRVDVTIFGGPAKVGILQNIGDCCRYFKKIRPDVVYAYTYYNAAYVLLAAKMCGVRVRIVHAHTSATEHKKTLMYRLYAVISRVLISCVATDKLACSDVAGRSLFYGKYRIIKNGIDLEKFKYNESIRNEIRARMKVGPRTILLGTIGRLDNNKNQIFMLKVLSELRDKNVKLMIVGDGPDRKMLVSSARKMGIEDRVIFVGPVDDSYKYYSAFDVFLLTSYHEGSPFVLIEAQANGVPVIASDTIWHELKINDNMQFLGLHCEPKAWANIINDCCGARVRPGQKILDYSVKNVSEQIINLYKKGENVCQ